MTEVSHLTAVDRLRALHAGPWPELVLVLGSGLGDVIADIEVTCRFAYAEVPGFPQLGVAGHAGTLTVGTLGGTAVTVMQGREHFYENGRADAMAVPIRALRALGSETLLMTNAAGSIHPHMPPGSLMAVTDHINLTGANPLIGNAAGDDRFVDMVGAYNPTLRETIKASAQAAGLDIFEGVYVGFSGPSFETPAEIRASAILGGDAVGMSLVPETILARHCGLTVGAVSVMTNFAAGVGTERLSHAQTMAAAGEAAPRCRKLIETHLSRLAASANAG